MKISWLFETWVWSSSRSRPILVFRPFRERSGWTVRASNWASTSRCCFCHFSISVIQFNSHSPYTLPSYIYIRRHILPTHYRMRKTEPYNDLYNDPTATPHQPAWHTERTPHTNREANRHRLAADSKDNSKEDILSTTPPLHPPN